MGFRPFVAKSLSLALACTFAGGLLQPVMAKRLSFQLPPQDKMTAGSGPMTNTPGRRPQAGRSGGQGLGPIGLGDDAPVEASDGYLKSSVSKSEFAPQGSGQGEWPGGGRSESLVGGGLGDKLLKDAKKVDVLPLALMESEGESEVRAATIMDSERRQLSELWGATMSRNPDIQFVINKLQPTSNSSHAMATTMKALSGALFGAMNLAPLALPGGATGANPGAVMGMGAGASLIQGLFADQNEKAAKKQAISQEQATILYKIVRDTADKLVGSYRDYKKTVLSVDRASADLQDLQSMVAEARGGQDAARQVEMEYTLRKARREIEKELEEVRRKRQELTDLAGNDAVARLDQEIQEERLALEKLTGSDSASAQDAAQGPFQAPAANVGQKTATRGSSQIQ